MRFHFLLEQRWGGSCELPCFANGRIGGMNRTQFRLTDDELDGSQIYLFMGIYGTIIRLEFNDFIRIPLRISK
jgi:hypothetical protein